MARKSIPSTTIVAAVRRHFGLQQPELAAYLGISAELVKHIEAGRRTLTGRVMLRLNPLAALLPAEAPVRPAAPAPEVSPLVAPAPGPLEARLDVCRQQAARLRRELGVLSAGQAQARRWQAVLPGLLATAADSALADTDADTVRARQWLLARQQQTAATLGDAAEAGRYHLLRLRAEALEAEAAGLAGLL